MSERYLYHNARIKHMELKLLTAQSVTRLLECSSLSAAYRTLLDMGFGAGASIESGDFDGLFEWEEQRQLALIEEFNVDGALDAFLMQYDSLNLRLYLKSKLSGKPYPKLSVTGLYSEDTLKECIESEEPEKVIPAFGEVVGRLKRLAIEDRVTPHLIDTEVEKQSYKSIFDSFKRKDALMKCYFVQKVDFANLLALLRCRKLGLDESFFKEGFIEGGSLAQLKDMYGCSDDELKVLVKDTPYFASVSKVLDGGSLVAFEVAADNALLKLIKDKKDDLFSVAPIAAFYLSRVTELKVAKLIVAGIKNGVDQELIRERMRELYA